MIYHCVKQSYHFMIGSRLESAMTPPAERTLRTSPWATVAWAIGFLAASGLVVVVWVQDVPETPFDERWDVFLLLALLVAVVAYTVESAPGRARAASRRAWPGWSMIVASLVGRRKR
jgi:hypothetical protein